MIAGPLGGWAIKKFDVWLMGKIKSGFEMLVNNFSAGIIGMSPRFWRSFGIGPAVVSCPRFWAAGVNFMVAHDNAAAGVYLVELAKTLPEQRH